MRTPDVAVALTRMRLPLSGPLRLEPRIAVTASCPFPASARAGLRLPGLRVRMRATSSECGPDPRRPPSRVRWKARRVSIPLVAAAGPQAG